MMPAKDYAAITAGGNDCKRVGGNDCKRFVGDTGQKCGGDAW